MKLHPVCGTLSLILGTVPFLLGATLPEANPRIPPPAPVMAMVIPEGTFSSIAIGEMGREASRILKNSGVALRWRLGLSSESTDSLLVVVRLHGRCEMDGASAMFRPGPLGWSDEADGKVLPFSELACDTIRGAITSESQRETSLPPNVLLGRAMGRVLAHELYHIMADTAEHGKDGVAQPAFSTSDLTYGQLSLEPADSDAIQDGLRGMGR